MNKLEKDLKSDEYFPHSQLVIMQIEESLSVRLFLSCNPANCETEKEMKGQADRFQLHRSRKAFQKTFIRRIESCHC